MSGSRSVSLSNSIEDKFSTSKTGLSDEDSVVPVPAAATAATAVAATTTTSQPDSTVATATAAALANSSSSSGSLKVSTPIVAATTDLDIVGAIGNLDLDDVDDPTITQPSQQQQPFLNNYNRPFYPPYQGSLTPQALSMKKPSTVSTNPNNTTPSTWNPNYIPNSAPPLVAYTENDLPMFVKPFELPETKEDAQNKQQNGLKLFNPTTNTVNNPIPDKNIMSTFIPQSINQQQLPPQGPHFPPPPPHHTILGPYPGTYPPPVPTPPEFRQFDNSPMNPPMIPGAPNANMWTSQIMTPPPGANMRNSNYVDHTLMHQPMMNNTNHGGNRYNTHRYPHRGNFDGMNTHRKNNGKPRRGDDASKYANAKLSDFVGDILNLCKDQHGCRFLQRQLELDKGAATIIFQEIYFKIVELMIDPFGNYLIQKLFEHITVEQRIVLVKNASGEFMKISMDPHGTRALQKLIECISTAEESKLIIEALQPHIVILSRDLNGNHVVQKCLQNLKTSDNQFIFDAVCANCLVIATHRHGCCVLQRCLDHGDPLQRQQLSLKIAENATKLAIDPFGNYVVQYVLSHGDDKSIEIILNHIKSNTIALSLHKFGSNVIEKSLRINKLSNQLIEVLLLNESRFEELLNDGFGNYVLQTSLDVASPTDLARLSQSLIPLLPNIKNTPHGRRIMNKLQSME